MRQYQLNYCQNNQVQQQPQVDHVPFCHKIHKREAGRWRLRQPLVDASKKRCQYSLFWCEYMRRSEFEMKGFVQFQQDLEDSGTERLHWSFSTLVREAYTMGRSFPICP